MCDSGCANVVIETDGLPVFDVDDDVVDDLMRSRVCDAFVGVGVTTSLSSVDDCSVTHWRRMWRRETFELQQHEQWRFNVSNVIKNFK